MPRGRLLGILTTLLGIAFSGAASAHPSQMVTGGLTSQPIGHYELCKRIPKECSARSNDVSPVAWSDDFRRRLAGLSESINKAIKPMYDIDIYGKDEFWTYPTDRGDCEDYALQKRRVLMNEGVSPANLLLTVLKKSNGEGHAVLTVRTEVGDYILDNLTDDLLPWDETGYLFLKRQATYHTGRWVSIRDGDAPLVGALH